MAQEALRSVQKVAPDAVVIRAFVGDLVERAAIEGKMSESGYAIK